MIKFLSSLEVYWSKKLVKTDASLGDSTTSGTAVTLKTERREVPGSNPGRACRPSRSEFSVVFSETRVNTG